ncbi:MAG: glutathione S-transferase C-terminal domain-containing protein [Clostridia bacterium]|nr:glutathione S-transferase C-terminal domain-containing protein [Clostridia bacterium]
MSEVRNTCGFNTAEEAPKFTEELADKLAKERGLRVRPSETVSETDERGVFVRQANTFITAFGDKEGEFKAEANRYKIFWAHGCHWSNRPVIVRDILGLEDVIDDLATTMGGSKYGHSFNDQKDFRDPTTGAYFLSEFYENAKPGFSGRATTPTLVDVKEKKAVNNDYHRLTNYIEVQFRKFQKTDIDLYPKAYRKEIDEFNDWLFPTINNGHYRMAFGTSWVAYQEAYEDFFNAIEKIEERLKTNRFLFGDYITDSDVRLYVTLVRWETGYFHNVGPLKKRIAEYENIWGYVKELFSIPEFRKYTFFEFPSNPDKTKRSPFGAYLGRIASQIPFDELWKTDGSRKALSEDPENVYLHTDVTPEEYQSEISFSKWNLPSWDDRQPRNVSISVDPSINPLKGLLKNK